MKQSELLSLIRQAVREEVRAVIRQEFGNAKVNVAESNSYKTPDVELPPRRQAPTHQYSKNPLLNDILNETATSPNEVYQIDYNDMEDWNTMPMSGIHNTPMATARVIPTTDINGNRVDPNRLPDGLTTALTRDYSALVKAMNKK